jgi:hypothetical protein
LNYRDPSFGDNGKHMDELKLQIGAKSHPPLRQQKQRRTHPLNRRPPRNRTRTWASISIRDGERAAADAGPTSSSVALFNQAFLPQRLLNFRTLRHAIVESF